MNRTLQTWQVFIQYAQQEFDVYVVAATAEDAIEDARADLPLNLRRWAHLFV